MSQKGNLGAFNVTMECTIRRTDTGNCSYSNIQVTLQILRALIEKLPRDLPLYASFVLRIIGTVLRSNEISTIEETLPTFEAFCAHHDVATLAADQEHVGLYEEVVRKYATFGSLSSPVKVKGVLSRPQAIRWRSAGIRAIRSITSSEAIGADGGRQLKIIMPVILQNLHPDDEDYLNLLHKRVETTEIVEKEATLKRRTSVSTVQTSHTALEAESTATLGTADDADRRAEEDVGMQALMSLKQIFVANNRLQIRLATTPMLAYICNEVVEERPGTGMPPRTGSAGTWATTLTEIVTRWAPVQDRYVGLVMAMESLIRTPIIEENLENQLVLVGLVGWLLRSNINLIGLSVMDVLLGLIQHILLVLQLGGTGSNILPHHQQTDAIDLFQETTGLINRPSLTKKNYKEGEKEEVSAPSSSRQELLLRLQKCIGDLATHIYYSDQISDIIIAILQRLKPSPMFGIANGAAAVENPRAAAQAISASVKLQENPSTDEFFSFGTARATALKAVREVLIIANMRGSISGAAASGRNRVGVQVWEGTQWLIRDDDRRVRRAYADALLTWLRLEMSRGDLRVMEDKRKFFKGPGKSNADGKDNGNMTRRAVSNASHREKAAKPAKSTFLQLLHLAIYNNAIEAPDNEADLLLMHLLLVNLVDKLGVNAAKSGLPMIMRLQEDVNNDSMVSTPTAKLNVGSLVHGYLWALSSRFDLDTTSVGFEIHSEISRRRKHGLWLESIQVPPIQLDQIMSASARPRSGKLPSPTLRQESLRPFDSRASMVKQIAIAYASAVASPPTSPPASPGRVFSLPILSPSSPGSMSENELPARIKEAMLAVWSKELCIAMVENESSRTISLNGSRADTKISGRQHLAVDGKMPRSTSPLSLNGSRHVSPPNRKDQALNNNLPYRLNRKSSARGDDSPTPVSSSDQSPTLRVDDLKKVLAGGSLAGRMSSSRGASPLRHASSRGDYLKPRDRRSVSSGSDSVVSAEGFESASEGDLTRPLPPAVSNPPREVSKQNTPRTPPATEPPPSMFKRPTPRNSEDRDQRPRSGLRPPSSSSSAGEDPVSNARALRGEVVAPLPTGTGDQDDDDVPPVPPLPPGVAHQKNASFSPLITQASGAPLYREAPESELTMRDSRAGSLKVKKRVKGIDINALLGSIDAVAGDRGSFVGKGKPPY